MKHILNLLRSLPAFDMVHLHHRIIDILPEVLINLIFKVPVHLIELILLPLIHLRDVPPPLISLLLLLAFQLLVLLHFELLPDVWLFHGDLIELFLGI